MSSAAVRLSLLSPAHGRPAGHRLRQLLSLRSSSAPVPALSPELPVGRREPSVLPWRPSPPRLLFLPAPHVWWTFCFWGPWLWYSRRWDWLPPRAAGGVQPAVCLASLVFCPAITLPTVWQPAAPLARPATPLSHTVKGHGELKTDRYSSRVSRSLICVGFYTWRNQHKRISLTLWKRMDLLPMLAGYSSVWTFFLNWDTWTLHVRCGMMSVNHYFQVLIMCLLTVFLPSACTRAMIGYKYLLKHSAGEENCNDWLTMLTTDSLFLYLSGWKCLTAAQISSGLLSARANHMFFKHVLHIATAVWDLSLESATVTWLRVKSVPSNYKEYIL